MRKVQLLIVIIFMLTHLIACKEKSLKDIIDGGGYRYWRGYSSEVYDQLLYFDNEGNFTVFEALRKEPFVQYHKMIEYGHNDDLIYRVRSLENDSTICFDGHRYHFAIENDTIMILKSIMDVNFRDTLYAVPRGKIPPKFRNKFIFKKIVTKYF